MLFSSMTFLWLFLPAVLLINRLLPAKWSNVFLAAASLFFYAWGEPYYVLLILFSICFNWYSCLLMAKHPSRRKLIMVFSAAVNLLLLVFFKYLGMLVQTANSLLAVVGIPPLPDPGIALPIGISFFTFQALSYVIDVYRGQVQVQKKLLNVALYISFFPQLIAGPIVRYKDVNEQIESRRVTGEKFYQGIRRFIYGLGKKVLLSNVLAQSADAIFNTDVAQVTGLMAWTAAILYTFQLYYDFSGYSDMAIGLGKMFGFDFGENFIYPYTARSIQEFWRRWHVSLSTWFKEYVYIPLGGNRKGAKRTYLNLLIVFLLTGAWHGASHSFILWGLYHGFFQIIERLGFSRFLKKHKGFAWVYTLAVVIFGWIFFRVEALPDALHYVKCMLTPWAYTNPTQFIQYYVNGHTLAMLLAAVMGLGFIQRLTHGQAVSRMWKGSAAEAFYLTGVLGLCFAALASSTYNPFIYFQF